MNEMMESNSSGQRSSMRLAHSSKLYVTGQLTPVVPKYGMNSRCSGLPARFWMVSHFLKPTLLRTPSSRRDSSPSSTRARFSPELPVELSPSRGVDEDSSRGPLASGSGTPRDSCPFATLSSGVTSHLLPSAWLELCT